MFHSSFLFFLLPCLALLILFLGFVWIFFFTAFFFNFLLLYNAYVVFFSFIFHFFFFHSIVHFIYYFFSLYSLILRLLFSSFLTVVLQPVVIYRRFVPFDLFFSRFPFLAFLIILTFSFLDFMPQDFFFPFFF